MKKNVLVVLLLAVGVANICGQTSFLGVKVNQPFESAVAEMKKIARFEGYFNLDSYSADFKHQLYGHPVNLSIDRDKNGIDVHCIYACFKFGMDDDKLLNRIVSEYSKKYGKYTKSIEEDGAAVLYTWQTNDAEVNISSFYGICIQYYPKHKQ